MAKSTPASNKILLRCIQFIFTNINQLKEKYNTCCRVFAPEPNVIDKAAIELIESLQNKFEQMSQQDFILAKKKNFDSIASARYDLSTISEKYFTKIVEQNYRFFNYLKMENYSKSIRKEDLLKFYNDNFIDPNLKLTVYVNLF